MPKMQIVTDAMLDRAGTIGQAADLLFNNQNAVTQIFQNMGHDFSGRVPGLMTQHMIAMESNYKSMNTILSNYRNFMEDAARNYEWTEDELARWAESLGEGTGAQSASSGALSGNTGTTPPTSTGSAVHVPPVSETQSQEPEQEYASTGNNAPIYSSPIATSADNDKWGWNTENLPFSHPTPDVSSYGYSNGDTLVNTRTLYNEWAHGNRTNCVYYARARYLEINGLDSYSFQENIYDPEDIKNGNCVVRCSGHSVYVEHYDAENDVVWFSDSNMASHQDGALQSMSFDDFLNFHGGFSYVEGRP